MHVSRRLSTCPYCGVGCGVRISQENTASQGSAGIGIEGDSDHPANFGRLCSKGSALAETLDLGDRLLQPRIAGKRSSWQQTLACIAKRFRETLETHGPESIAFYVSGQLLTEDYYVANKFVKGWLGTANIDTNSRLCMASTVAGQRRAFGSDTVPGRYEDIETADLVIIVGSNLAWCHPVLFQRLAAARQSRPDMKVVQIDPRRTATTELADEHLPIRPDSDAALFTTLLAWLAEHGYLDHGYLKSHTTGLAAALEAASACDLASASVQTGLPVDRLQAFFARFAATRRTVTLFSQGVNQSAGGTDKVNAIINCHLATGRIGRTGMGPLSLTGQPNAMGGREVGGMANMLAAHLELEQPAHRELVQRFWQSPAMACKPGLKAVNMMQGVADGRVQAVWILATNPAHSLPEARRVERALARCPFVIVSDVSAHTDTLRHADVVLPAQAWGEKDGTVTNSERCISRQRRFRQPPPDTRPDWWAVARVACLMGAPDSAFGYTTPAEIFREHAELSALENHGSRSFDIGACASLSDAEYERLAPFQWPWAAGTPRRTSRFFATGGFHHDDGRARIVPITPLAPVNNDTAWPLILNTGRVRDQWHTMTRTGLSARLSAHMAEPFVELHPMDAASCGVGVADLVDVRSSQDCIRVRALITDRAQPGSVFVPMHWGDQFASNGRVGTLVGARCDPLSGQPASKSEAVQVQRFEAGTYGYAVLRDRPTQLDEAYWAMAPCESGWQLEFASLDTPADTMIRWLSRCLIWGEPVCFVDESSATLRVGIFQDDRLLCALFLAPDPVAVPRSWAQGLLVQRFAEPAVRHRVLAARPGTDQPDKGSIVCACHGVGSLEIVRAVCEHGCRSVSAVGELSRAGTQCGSCRSEIQALIGRSRDHDMSDTTTAIRSLTHCVRSASSARPGCR